MLQELVESPGERDPDALYEAYRRELAAVVDSVGVDTAAAETGVDEAVLAALPEADELVVADAAAILSLEEGRPDATAIRQEALDDVLLGMTTAVLDVDAIAANVALDRSPKEIQQRVEGRTPMTLREFAHVHGFVAGRQR
jgi:hypothetical protein